MFIKKQHSNQLQSPHTNMAKAATMETLQQFRSDKEWNKLYKYVVDVASLHNMEIAPLRSQRQRTMPKRSGDVIVLESTGFRETVPNDDYKNSLYFPVLAALISVLYRLP